MCPEGRWLLVDSVDPSGELQWLTDQLHEAEQLGEKVHLLSHIPPGISDCIPVWSHQFNRIVNRSAHRLWQVPNIFLLLSRSSSAEVNTS